MREMKSFTESVEEVKLVNEKQQKEKMEIVKRTKENSCVCVLIAWNLQQGRTSMVTIGPSSSKSLPLRIL